MKWKQQRGVSVTEWLMLGYNPMDELTEAILKDDASSDMPASRLMRTLLRSVV